MKVMLFMSVDKSVELAAEERARIPAAVGDWVAEMDARGVRLQGAAFVPGSEARTVRVRSGETRIADGPLTGAEPEITGFNILDCADMDEALEVAAKHPVATFGVLELRPFAG